MEPKAIQKGAEKDEKEWTVVNTSRQMLCKQLHDFGGWRLFLAVVRLMLSSLHESHCMVIL